MSAVVLNVFANNQSSQDTEGLEAASKDRCPQHSASHLDDPEAPALWRPAKWMAVSSAKTSKCLSDCMHAKNSIRSIRQDLTLDYWGLE
jgi:hypothetical protein